MKYGTTFLMLASRKKYQNKRPGLRLPRGPSLAKVDPIDSFGVSWPITLFLPGHRWFYNDQG